MTASAKQVQEPRRSLARDVLACLSLANLCYLNVWVELTGTGLDYFRKAPPSGVNIAAAAINVGVLALACFALLTILESQGVWDEATVILTSDHSLRPGEWRVSGAWTDEEAQVTGNRRSPYIPLLVKLPHSRAGRAYEQPVSMLVLHDLVLALARGEIRTNDDLASWLDQHRGRFPLPQGLAHARP